MLEFYPVTLKELNCEEWDELADRYGTIFHHSLWLRLWEKTFPFQSNVYLAVDERRIVGGIPFCQRQKYRFREAYSMPRGCYGGVVIAPEHDLEVRRQLESEFTCWCLREEFSRINLIEFSPEVNTNLEDYGIKPISTHLLNLKYSSEEQLNKIVQSHKRNLPKSFDQGFRIEQIASAEQLESFYELIEQTASRQERRTFYKRNFYHSLLEIFGGVPKIYWPAVVLEGQILASAIVFIHRKSAVYWDGASSPEALEKGANFFLFWHIIQYLKEREIEIFDFGASPGSRPGLKRFKSGWGAERISYFEYNYQKTISKMAGKVKGLF